MRIHSLLTCLCGLYVIAPAWAGPKLPPALIVKTPEGVGYNQNERGDRIPDFSLCGYAGGDQKIPLAPVRVVVSAIKGDETELIQRALDYVGSLPVDANGLRGTVLLLKGQHKVSGGLIIKNSGVVLRGQGIGEGGTTLIATGKDRRTLIRVNGNKDINTTSNAGWQVTDAYVPVGATSFALQSVEGLKVGDSIRVTRPCTQEWIDRIGAMEFGGGEGARWKVGSREIVWNRTIQAIDGTKVTLNAPITTALEAAMGGGKVETYSWAGRISNIGIENLQLESTFNPKNPKDEDHSWFAITMESAMDAWVRQVTFKHFAGSAVALYETTQQVTVEDCRSLAPVSEDGGYRRNTFFTMGQQTLFINCYSEYGCHDFSVGDCAAGPNAFVQCHATLPLSDSGAIESWSSGTLFDNVRIDGNALSLGYRAGNMEAIGWAAANSVLWNCSASIIRVWNPPGAQNWSFGSWAGFEGNGEWRDSNSFANPSTLHGTQLSQRTKRDFALLLSSFDSSTRPSAEEAAKFIVAARKPAPLLTDYIAEAGKRNPIPCEAGNAKRVEELPVVAARPKAKHLVAIKNGWIVSDGKLLVGTGSGNAWWQGSIRPNESGNFKSAITRFAPGRIGEGLTDELDVLARKTANKAWFDYHYGLWYDRRRDDHERIRRMTGDVIPPLFEQPFARSGQGTAWDGLSKYDLTKPSYWYWNRLKTFADLGEENGFLLFHKNYFQHNILEAGAHWVDNPWRTTNNINSPGFPEPQNFAGDKRVFMAEQFYDITNPALRKLHAGYIRQCLENFKGNSNVIQFTGEEFTGPTHFVQFWLDTIGQWERENGKSHPLIALNTPKNVQDAILADPKRRKVVDVIAFTYWVRTDKGDNAPDGGRNLAPRQSGNVGGTSDKNLASMASEYRNKFGKSVITDLSSPKWAWICAGGSIPNIPRSTDEKLLTAIPQMQPWTEASKEGRWVLRETGKQYMVYGGGELDLSSESGVFRVNTIDENSGDVKATAQTVKGGDKVPLPDGVVWLTRTRETNSLSK